MSSNCAPLSPISPPLFGRFAGSIAVLLFAVPLSAQDEATNSTGDGGAENAEQAEAPPPRPRREIIDISVTVPRNESDRLIEQDCEEESDAATIANEIVVCRQLGEATDGSWDAEDWQRRYAERTQGEQPVDVAGDGIFRGPATVSGLCVIPPCPPEAAIMIDVEALPQAPEGSDADRIARGLPPLGEDELTPEEIAQRRRALGLDAPPVPEE